MENIFWETDSQDLLGIKIDNTSNFDSYVSKLCTKASQICHYISCKKKKKKKKKKRIDF